MSKLDELWNEAYRLGYAHAYEEREAFEKAVDAFKAAERKPPLYTISAGSGWGPEPEPEPEPEPPKPVEAPYTIGGKYTREQAWDHTSMYGSTWEYTDAFGRARTEYWDETHRKVTVHAPDVDRGQKACAYLVSEYRSLPWTLLHKGTDRR